jgi:hypothetical protein
MDILTRLFSNVKILKVTIHVSTNTTKIENKK